MHGRMKKPIVFVVSIVFITSAFLNIGSTVSGQEGTPKVVSIPLYPRAVFPKPAKTVITNPEDGKVMVLKFREGTRIRLRNGQLTAELANLSLQEQNLLKRAQLTETQILKELGLINQLLILYKVPFTRLFTRPEDKLEYEKLHGELNSGEELADLNLYYYLFPPLPVRQTEELINQFNALNIVETAYPQPPAVPAAADILPMTPDRTASQGYLNEASTLNPASNGIDARYALSRGARGQGVRIIDVEGSWNLAHEDLNPVFYRDGDFADELDWRNHGTAVLGEIVGANNSYGVTGIAPDAKVGVSAIFRHFIFRYSDPASAMNNAAAQLRPGDIMLIEVGRRGPGSGETCLENCKQFEMLALEYWQADFDAIRNATARGILVVEAAGNGSMNLDAPRYEGRFTRALRDSGAIMVGAGFSNSRAPHVWSNAGSRVDVQGWGDSVMTLGSGMIRENGTDEKQWYTDQFAGTSSAAPIVAGAAAVIHGYLRTASRPTLDAFQMRALLRSTGTPQIGSRRIGPLPNLRAALLDPRVGAHPRLSAMRLIAVRESDRDVNTGLDIRRGDRVSFLAAGEIWSGEWITGWRGLQFAVTNGPQGWRSTAATSFSFPHRGVAPYSLLGRFGGTSYFYVGRSGEQLYGDVAPARLFLRINDDLPGNGNGEFWCLVQVYR